MKQHRISYYGLIGWILMAITSCSKVDLEQEATSADIDDTFTRADLVEYTINVGTAGTLGSLVKAGNYANAQKLIVTGNIGYEDVNYVDKNMTTVEVLDLSGATYNSTSLSGEFLSWSTSIKEISLPKGVESIGYMAFVSCSSLTSINIPKGVTSIGNYAFWDCSSLTSITIPEGVKSIGDEAFSGCSSLTSINIPEGVTSIGSGAFYYCISLTSINIPESVTSIGSYAFGDCSSLTSINIPESVTSIEEKAFYGCSSLISITIPKSVTRIANFAFEGCSSLTNITIQEGVTHIGWYAFDGCSSLTSITIPEGVTNIEYRAFWDCSSLTSINIPESVKNIGDEVFERCNSLQKLICNSSCNIKDLSSSNNLYCWLIINRSDGKLPTYGPNWKNVVINGVAESVTLPYHKKADFTIPEEVKSIKKISYTMTFDANTNSSSYGIWRTIALPFKPTHITNAEKGELAPFDSGEEGALNFWLRELTTEGFKDVTQIEPNRPYLIAMPYSMEYADKYNISGDVTFSAENLTSEDLGNYTPLSAVGTDYTMYASYSYMDRTEGIYSLANYSSNQFKNNSYSVYPFEAYLKANTATMRSVISLDQGRTATRAIGNDSRKPQKDDM